MNAHGLTQEQETVTNQLSYIKTGIQDAKRDFPRLYDFYAGKCKTEDFHRFLAIGDFYTEPLTRAAWKRTIFKEIDRIEALFDR